MIPTTIRLGAWFSSTLLRADGSRDGKGVGSLLLRAERDDKRFRPVFAFRFSSSSESTINLNLSWIFGTKRPRKEVMARAYLRAPVVASNDERSLMSSLRSSSCSRALFAKRAEKRSPVLYRSIKFKLATSLEMLRYEELHDHCRLVDDGRL